MAAAELGVVQSSFYPSVSDSVFLLCQEVWGPLHIPVAPFTPDTDKDPTLSGAPSLSGPMVGVTGWWCDSRCKTPSMAGTESE